jgi:hypothetical protein
MPRTPSPRTHLLTPSPRGPLLLRTDSREGSGVLAATRRSPVCDRARRRVSEASGDGGGREGGASPPNPLPQSSIILDGGGSGGGGSSGGPGGDGGFGDVGGAVRGTAAVVPPPAARVVAAAAGAASPRRRSMFYVPTQGSSTASTGPCPRTRRLWRERGQRLRPHLPPGAGARGQRRVCVPLRGAVVVVRVRRGPRVVLSYTGRQHAWSALASAALVASAAGTAGEVRPAAVRAVAAAARAW